MTVGTCLTKELMDQFLAYLTSKGNSRGSVTSYRTTLEQFYRFLPDGQITEDTGAQWREYLTTCGYVQGTVNYKVSVYNSLLEFLGRREWQVLNFPPSKNIQPELTRAEYVRLLSAAKVLEQRRTYLLIKTLGGAGIRLQELPQLTVEAARRGSVKLKSGGQTARIVHLPGALREELMEYAATENITEGPIFANERGKPLDRTTIFHSIRALGKAARVDEEKASPRCLLKMYQSTWDGIQRNLQAIAEQTYERVFETEQITVGWEA